MNFKPLWQKWLEISKKISNFNILLIFTLIYFLLLWLPGLLTRFFSDPLKIKQLKKNSNFTKWDYKDDLAQAKKSY